MRRLLVAASVVLLVLLALPEFAFADNCTGTTDTQNCMAAINAATLITALLASGALAAAAVPAFRDLITSKRHLTPKDESDEVKERQKRRHCEHNAQQLKTMAKDIDQRIRQATDTNTSLNTTHDLNLASQHRDQLRQLEVLVEAYSSVYERWRKECADSVAEHPPDLAAIWKRYLCKFRRDDHQRLLSDYERYQKMIREITEAEKEYDDYYQVSRAFLTDAAVARNRAEEWLGNYYMFALAPRAFLDFNKFLMGKAFSKDAAKDVYKVWKDYAMKLGWGAVLALKLVQKGVETASKTVVGVLGTAYAVGEAVTDYRPAKLIPFIGRDVQGTVAEQADSIRANLAQLKQAEDQVRWKRENLKQSVDLLRERYRSDPLSFDEQMNLYRQIELANLMAARTCGTSPSTLAPPFPRGARDWRPPDLGTIRPKESWER